MVYWSYKIFFLESLNTIWMLGVTGQLDQNVLWYSKWKMVVAIEIERDTHRLEICVVVAERGGYKEEPRKACCCPDTGNWLIQHLRRSALHQCPTLLWPEFPSITCS